MSLFHALMDRAHVKCELCRSSTQLALFEIPPIKKANADTALIVCDKCKSQLEHPSKLDSNHWRCLSDSIWSEYQAVKIVAYRILVLLKTEPWAENLFEQLDLEGPSLELAKSIFNTDNSERFSDSNRVKSLDSDPVTLIKKS